jgi:predicted transporter
MCPVCFTTVALTVIATASGSALTVFVAKTLRVPIAAPAQAPKSEV